MVDRLLAFVEDQRLFGSNSKLLLAVSGGIDSMVLLHLFEQLSYNFSIAHCNFSLRGKESDEDESFVKSYAKSKGIECFTQTFNTKKYATTHNISTQMAARDLRYEWFKELIDVQTFDRVVTAHHLNDSLETSLFNWTKGTGLAGLKGISPKRSHFVRPLMSFTRGEIESYAEDQALRWREDSSNASVKYHRNLIRHHVVPELKKINPLLDKTFLNTARRISESEETVDLFVDSLSKRHKKIISNDIWIDKKALINSVVVYKLIKEYGFAYTQAVDVLKSVSNSNVGSVFETSSFRLNVDRDHIIITKINGVFKGCKVFKTMERLELPQYDLLFEAVPANIDMLSIGRNVSLDFSKLEFPLTIRKWEQGDKFIPLGMKGKKKVSDFMIDTKIPLNLKSRVLVLQSGNDIAWLIGHRVDERFKVTPKSKMMYNITIQDHD